MPTTITCARGGLRASVVVSRPSQVGKALAEARAWPCPLAVSHSLDTLSISSPLSHIYIFPLHIHCYHFFHSTQSVDIYLFRSHLFSFFLSLSLSLSLSFFFFSFFSLLLQKDLSLSPLLMCLLSIPNVSVSLVPFLKIFCFVCVYSFHLFFRIPR